MSGSMKSLMQAAPEQEMEYGSQLGDPAALLQQAIELHEAHLAGTEPTSPESQQQLMDLLIAALNSLGSGSTDLNMS